MDISLGRRFLLTSVKYRIPTYLSLPSLKVSCPNPPPPMRNSRKQLKKVDLWGGPEPHSRNSDTQTFRRSDVQTVRESDSQTFRHSDSQTVGQADIETVRHSDSHL